MTTKIRPKFTKQGLDALLRKKSFGERWKVMQERAARFQMSKQII